MIDIDRKVYRLDDAVIAQIVRIIQIGFLTGTDVADHMRQLVVEQGPRLGILTLTPEYKEHHARDIDTMFEELEGLMEMPTSEQS